jgi:hypothetical protein
MELWQILLICLLMLPAFFLANYLVVTRMARNRRERDERIDRAAAESVARSYSDRRLKYESWPKYRHPRKKQ